ncbi:MAG: hypothetical protein LBT23_00415 [Synergistaceae bacterium]|jgi:hypothetical protein|nr:hypothetical protein [Synergistaceae bacterium]
MTKNNAVRLLEAANAKFTAREYDVSDGEISGVAVAWACRSKSRHQTLRG